MTLRIKGRDALPEGIDDYNIIVSIEKAIRDVNDVADPQEPFSKKQVRQRHANLLVDYGYEMFARRNGWLRGDREFGFVSVETGKRMQRDYLSNYSFPGVDKWIDHPVFFRRPPHPSRPAALVSQPYGWASPNFKRVDHENFWRSNRWADRYRAMDLECIEAPMRWASIYNPGACRFLVVVKKGTEVKWLPEQAINERYAAHDSERKS